MNRIDRTLRSSRRSEQLHRTRPTPAPPAPPPSAAPQPVSVLLSSCFLPCADYGPLDPRLFCQVHLPFGRQALGPVSKPRSLPANVAGARNAKDRPIRVGLTIDSPPA